MNWFSNLKVATKLLAGFINLRDGPMMLLEIERLPDVKQLSDLTRSAA